MEFNYLYFDIYSKRISFFYNNHEKIGSYFGLFLTVLYITFSLTLFIYNLDIAFQRKDMKVYDSIKYHEQIPSMNIDSNNFYFAFGLEDPISLNRFIDESIYYPQISFIYRIKENGEFITKTKKILEFENCKEGNFGQNYQHLFMKDELNNSYCLKDFNYSLALSGGFKYEKMSYIRIKIFPCRNSSENNNHCKPQDIIDYYFSSNYFSILIKNFGLNPSNYSFPIVPTLEDLFTTVDKGLYRNLIINYGITEIHTDKSLFNEIIEKKKYLQFKDAFQTFSFMDEKDYLNGKEICLIQLRLNDIIFIQKRTYTKISEIFSKMGGYMQLFHTIFSLLSLLINKFDSELKIINGIFNFNLEKNKMALKFQSLRDFDSINLPSYNKNLIFSTRKSVKKNIDTQNKSSKNIVLMGSNISSVLNMKKLDDCQSSKLDIKKNKNKEISFFGSPDLSNKLSRIKRSKFNKSKNDITSLNLNLYNVNNSMNFNNNINKINNNTNKKESNNNLKEFNDHINLNIFDFLFILCKRKNGYKNKHFGLFNLGISFYKKRMDLIHVFTLLLITERILLKKNK